MTKRGMALVVAAFMLFAAMPALAADGMFPDVPAHHWAYEAVARLQAAGLIEGYPDGTFGGERTFTRYEMAMVFDRILRRYDAYLAAALEDLGIDIGLVTEEFGPELGVMNALAKALADVKKEATEAKAIAEAAAESADLAGDRAYRARLAAEQALAQAKKANETAAIAQALAGDEGGEGFSDDVRQAIQRAQRIAADAEAAALRANAIAEMAFAATDDSLADTVEETRLAAQRAQRLAADAESAALKAQAMAERATTLAEAQVALEEVEAASDRAYRARLTAEQALALGRQADDKASRAMAMSEIAIRDTASVGEIAQEALDMALQADRLAYLAHLSAYRALDIAEDAQASAEDAQARLDVLEAKVATTPQITASLSANYEVAHTNAKDPKLIDPRGAANGPKTYTKNDMTLAVGLGAAVEPKDGVRVEGGIKFSSSVFGGPSTEVDLSNLYAQVTTEGFLRKGYFGSLSGDAIAADFHPFVLDGDTYEMKVTVDPADDEDDTTENLAGAFADFQAGNLSTRVVASKVNPKVADSDKKLLYGVASRLALADAMNISFSMFQGHDPNVKPATAFGFSGESGGLTYDWIAAQFDGDTAVDGNIGATIGDVEAGFTFRSIGEKFETKHEPGSPPPANTLDDNYYGKVFTEKDDGIEAGQKQSLLTLAAPVGALTLEYEKGRFGDLDDATYDDWHKLGFTEAPFLGFDVTAHYYLGKNEADDTTKAYRVGIDRTVQLGVPVKFFFVHAKMDDETQPVDKAHQAYGVALEEVELSETLTVDAGYKVERNALGADWTDPAHWTVSLRDDATSPPNVWGYVKDRTTLHARADLELTEGLTVFGGHTRVNHDTDKGDVVVATTDVGADYAFKMYTADVTLGYAWQNVTKDGTGFQFDPSPRSTYSISYEQPAWGGTLAAGYKLVSGRGSDDKNKVEARDMTAHLDYTYPVADGMDFTLGGKWTDSKDLKDSANDYYFTSVKAGFAVKF